MAGLTKLSLTTLRDSLLRVETLDSKRKDLEAKSSMESKILAQAKELEQLKIQLRRPKPLSAPKPSNPNWDKQCHHCGKFGHLINECRSNPANQGPIASMAMVQNQGRGRGRGRGYGRGGNGRGRGQAPGGQTGNVVAVAAAVQPGNPNGQVLPAALPANQ
ncbi:hypothetical protein HDE_00199 [Halotydeus destructor]|nr:hypothetical protein HDE_00199 [Halotydeus destructor]